MAVKTEGFLSGLDSYVSNAISRLSYDKTIQATITEVKDGGKYLVTNGNNTFEAVGTENAYKVNDTVFVLIPNGEFDQEKTILRKKISDMDVATEYSGPKNQIIIVSDNLTNLYQSQESQTNITNIKQIFVRKATDLIQKAENCQDLSSIEISGENCNLGNDTDISDLDFSVEELYEKYLYNYMSIQIPFEETYPNSESREDYFSSFVALFKELIAEAEAGIEVIESIEINKFGLFEEDFNQHRLNRLYFNFRPWCEAKPITKNLDENGIEITSILMKGTYTVQLIMTTESGHKFTFEIPSSELDGNLFPRNDYASYQDVCWNIDYDALLNEIESRQLTNLISGEETKKISFVPKKFEVNVVYGSGVTLDGRYVEDIHTQYPNITVNINEYEIYFGLDPESFQSSALNIWFVDESGNAIIKNSYGIEDWDAEQNNQIEPWRLQAAAYYKDPTTGQISRWASADQIDTEKEISLKWYINDYTAYKLANDPSGEGGWIQIKDAGEDINDKTIEELRQIVSRIKMDNSSDYQSINEKYSDNDELIQALSDLIADNRELSFNYMPSRTPLYFQQSIMMRAALYMDGLFTGTYSNVLVLNNNDFEKKEFMDEQEKFHIYSYQDPYAGAYMLYRLDGAWSSNSELLNKKLALRYDKQEIDQYLMSLAESNTDIFTIQWEQDVSSKCAAKNKNIILEKAVTSCDNNISLLRENSKTLSDYFVILVEEDTSLDIYIKYPDSQPDGLTSDQKIFFINQLLQEDNIFVNNLFETKYKNYEIALEVAENNEESIKQVKNDFLEGINFINLAFDKELLKLDFTLPGNGVYGLDFETFTARLYEENTAISAFYTIQMGTYSTSKTGTVLTLGAIGDNDESIRAIVQNEKTLTIKPRLLDQFGLDHIDEVTDIKWEWHSPKNEEDFIFQDADNLLYEREIFEDGKRSVILKSPFAPPKLTTGSEINDVSNLLNAPYQDICLMKETKELNIDLIENTNYFLNIPKSVDAYLDIEEDGLSSIIKISNDDTNSASFSVANNAKLNKIYFLLQENNQQVKAYQKLYEENSSDLIETGATEADIIISDRLETANAGNNSNSLSNCKFTWHQPIGSRVFFKEFINKQIDTQGNTTYSILDPDDLPNSNSSDDYFILAPFGAFGGQELKPDDLIQLKLNNNFVDSYGYDLNNSSKKIPFLGKILNNKDFFNFGSMDLDFELRLSKGTNEFNYTINLYLNSFKIRNLQIKDFDLASNFQQPQFLDISKNTFFLPLVEFTHPFCSYLKFANGFAITDLIFFNEFAQIKLCLLPSNYLQAYQNETISDNTIKLVLIYTITDMENMNLTLPYQAIEEISASLIDISTFSTIPRLEFIGSNGNPPEAYGVPWIYNTIYTTELKDIKLTTTTTESNELNKIIKRNFSSNDIFNENDSPIGNYQILSFSAMFKGERQTTYLPIGYTSVDDLSLLKMSRPSELIYYYNVATNRIFPDDKEKDNLLIAAKDNKAIISIDVIDQGQNGALLNAMSENKTFQIKNFYLYQNVFDEGNKNVINAQDPEKDWYLAAPNVYIPNNNTSIKFNLKENNENKIWIEPTFMMQNTIPSIIVSRWSGNDFGSTEDGIDYNVMSIVGHKNDNNEFTGVIIGGSANDDTDSSLNNSAISVFQDNVQTVKITEGGKAYFKGEINAESGKLGGLELDNGKLFGSIELGDSQLQNGEYGLNTRPKEDSLFLVGGAPKTLSSDDESWKTRISVLPEENPRFFVSSNGIMYSQQAYMFPSFIKLYNEKKRNLSYKDKSINGSKPLWLSLGEWITIEKDMEELTRYLKNKIQNKTLADLFNDLITLSEVTNGFYFNSSIIFSDSMENIIIKRFNKILNTYYKYDDSKNILKYKKSDNYNIVVYPSTEGDRFDLILANAVDDNDKLYLFTQTVQLVNSNQTGNVYTSFYDQSGEEMQVILQTPIDRYFDALSNILSFCVWDGAKWTLQSNSAYGDNIKAESYDLGYADVKDQIEGYNLFGHDI